MLSDPRDWLLYVLPQAPDEERLLLIARRALEGGADCLQLRLKNRGNDAWLAAGRALRNLCDEFRRPLMINDRPDIARETKADGVHLGQEDCTVAEARRQLAPGAIVGVSAATPAEADRAARDGADYVAVGPIWATPVKEGTVPLGTVMIGRVREAVDLPIIAIGGIDASNAADAIRSGADGVAVIGAVSHAPDPRASALRLREAVAAARLSRRNFHVH